LIVGANFAFSSWDTYAIFNSCFALLCVYYSKLGNIRQPKVCNTQVLH